MSTQPKFRHVKRVSQADENSLDSYNTQQIDVTSSITADYYNEWTIGNNLSEKPNSKRIDGLEELSSEKDMHRRILKYNSRSIKRNPDTNASTFYNEIYNRAELFNLP